MEGVRRDAQPDARQVQPHALILHRAYLMKKADRDPRGPPELMKGSELRNPFCIRDARVAAAQRNGPVAVHRLINVKRGDHDPNAGQGLLQPRSSHLARAFLRNTRRAIFSGGKPEGGGE